MCCRPRGKPLALYSYSRSHILSDLYHQGYLIFQSLTPLENSAHELLQRRAAEEQLIGVAPTRGIDVDAGGWLNPTGVWLLPGGWRRAGNGVFARYGARLDETEFACPAFDGVGSRRRGPFNVQRAGDAGASWDLHGPSVDVDWGAKRFVRVLNPDEDMFRDSIHRQGTVGSGRVAEAMCDVISTCRDRRGSETPRVGGSQVRVKHSVKSGHVHTQVKMVSRCSRRGLHGGRRASS